MFCSLAEVDRDPKILSRYLVRAETFSIILLDLFGLVGYGSIPHTLFMSNRFGNSSEDHLHGANSFVVLAPRNGLRFFGGETFTRRPTDRGGSASHRPACNLLIGGWH